MVGAWKVKHCGPDVGPGRYRMQGQHPGQFRHPHIGLENAGNLCHGFESMGRSGTAGQSKQAVEAGVGANIDKYRLDRLAPLRDQHG